MSARGHVRRARSHSASLLLQSVLFGRPKQAIWFGPRRLLVGDYVISLTRPSEPRMPNGIECSLFPGSRARVIVGGGRLAVGAVELDPGDEWNPVPAVSVHGRTPGPTPLMGSMADWDPALGAMADDMLAGYVAGLYLLHGSKTRAAQIAKTASLDADPWNATLLRHAALGEVPETVHALLERGDARPLLAWGRSGAWWLRGLLSAGYPLEDNVALMAAAGSAH